MTIILQEGLVFVAWQLALRGNGAALALGFILFILVGISIPIFFYYWKRHRK